MKNDAFNYTDSVYSTLNSMSKGNAKSVCTFPKNWIERSVLFPYVLFQQYLLI